MKCQENQENQETNQPILTRLLYPKLDVITSIYETYRTKESYDECVFWMCELYYSMFYDDAFYMLYFLYFSYNSLIDMENNHKLYFDIVEHHKKWQRSTKTSSNKTKTPTHKHFFAIFKKLYFSSYNHDVSDCIQEHQKDGCNRMTLFRGKKPAFLEKYDECSRQIIHSIYKNKQVNIFNYVLRQFTGHTKTKSKQGPGNKEGDSHNDDTNNEGDTLEKFKCILSNISTFSNTDEIENHGYKDASYFSDITQYMNIFEHFTKTQTHMHYTMTLLIIANAYICMTTQGKIDTIKPPKPTSPVGKLTKEKETMYKSYYNSKDMTTQPRKVLRECRQYALRVQGGDIINANTLLSMVENYGYDIDFYNNWIDYAVACPLWKSRIDNYDYDMKWIDGKHRITFKSDEDFESFYANYEYEPDEQPRDTSAMVGM